jgi:molecular chaperone DnaJ
MIHQNYYELLGLDRLATPEEIKKAYRRLAHQFHPDKNPGDASAPERFRRITEAYEVLQDAKKRAAYDRCGSSSGGRNFEGIQEPEDFYPPGKIFEDFLGEVFEDFFGIQGRKPAGVKGGDFRYNLEVSLEEAAIGLATEIKVPRTSVCPSCRGTRCSPGTLPTLCPSCRGWGSLRSQRGFFITSAACRHCGGEGRVILLPCSQCRGKGQIPLTRLLRIQIPPGVDTGTRLRLRGEGERGRNGGRPGDLYVFISVKTHPIFSRSGNDILCQIPVPLVHAVEGGEVEVPTLYGTAKIRIAPGTPAGKTFTLRGYGMPVLQGSGRGDQKVKLRVDIPSKLNKRHQELLDAFNRICAGAQGGGREGPSGRS